MQLFSITIVTGLTTSPLRVVCSCWSALLEELPDVSGGSMLSDASSISVLGMMIE